MNQGGMSMFHDDNEQLGNYCVLQSVSLPDFAAIQHSSGR